MCTAGHAAVNLPQYDEYGFTPNYPSLLEGEPPQDTVMLTDVSIECKVVIFIFFIAGYSIVSLALAL